MTRHGPRNRPAHRPTKLDPDVAKTIIDTVRAGNYLDTGAAYAGIGRSTLMRWLADADKPGAPLHLREFRDAVARARAEAEVRTVALIGRAMTGGYVLEETTRTTEAGASETTRRYAPPDGRLGLEYLSRVAPSRFGRRTAIEVSGPEGGPVKVEASDLGRIAGSLRDWLSDAPRVVEGEVVAEGQTLALTTGGEAGAAGSGEEGDGG